MVVSPTDLFMEPLSLLFVARMPPGTKNQWHRRFPPGAFPSALWQQLPHSLPHLGLWTHTSILAGFLHYIIQRGHFHCLAQARKYLFNNEFGLNHQIQAALWAGNCARIRSDVRFHVRTDEIGAHPIAYPDMVVHDLLIRVQSVFNPWLFRLLLASRSRFVTGLSGLWRVHSGFLYRFALVGLAGS